MAGDSPRNALDAFIERFRKAIACVGDAHVFGDGAELDRLHAVAIKPSRPGRDGRLALRARDSGQPDLLLDVTHEYTVIHTPDDDQRSPYKIRSMRYLYEVFDLEGKELLLYHWNPEGVSDIIFPHVHVAGAERMTLRRLRTDELRLIDIGKLHLPTGRILLEDVIELLIRDLGVEPRSGSSNSASPNFWKNVLDDNREAAKRGTTWVMEG